MYLSVDGRDVRSTKSKSHVQKRKSKQPGREVMFKEDVTIDVPAGTPINENTRLQLTVL